MRKLIYTMLAAGLCAGSAWAEMDPKAGASTVTTPTKTDGCYQINNLAELYGFAKLVNDGEKTACGKLTADITDNTVVQSDDGNAALYKSMASSSYFDFHDWTPIVGFAGTFDGGNHTISGLYYWAENDAGFFRSVYNGAVIKNLKIALSYFRVNSSNAGGLIDSVLYDSNYSGSMVRIENCERTSGTVAGGEEGSGLLFSSNTGGTNIGGFVAVVASGAKLVISNSAQKAIVLSSYPSKAGATHIAKENNVAGTHVGGLVAYVESGATVSIANSYNAGKTDDDHGSSISAFIGTNAGTVETDHVYCLSTQANCSTTDYGTALESQTKIDSAEATFESSNLLAYYTADIVDSILGGADTHPGVTFSDDGTKLVATITDALFATKTDTKFYIPQNIKVDSVNFARSFTTDVYSTIMLPFEVAKSNTNGTFYSPTSVDVANATVSVSEQTGTLSANTPYILSAGATELTVSGAVTLTKTPDGETVTSAIGSTGWSLVGTLKYKRWQKESEDAEGNTVAGTNTDEIGRVYGFAGSDPSKTGFEIGDFVKVGTKVAIRPMRAYLISDGTVQNMPALSKSMAYAPAATETASITVLPDTMKVIIVEPATNDTITIGGGENDDITAIQTAKVPANIVKTNRWFDVTGRSLKSPKAKGAYVNNRTPVIVK